MMTQTNLDITPIYADQLTEGDVWVVINGFNPSWGLLVVETWISN